MHRSTGASLYANFAWSQVNLLATLRQRWLLGLACAVVVGLLMVRNVLSQPPSPRSEGVQFFFDLMWCGVVYVPWMESSSL